MKVKAVIVDELPPSCTFCDFNCILNAYDLDKDLAFECGACGERREMPLDDKRYDFCPLVLGMKPVIKLLLAKLDNKGWSMGEVEKDADL